MKKKCDASRCRSVAKRKQMTGFLKALPDFFKGNPAFASLCFLVSLFPSDGLFLLDVCLLCSLAVSQDLYRFAFTYLLIYYIRSLIFCVLCVHAYFLNSDWASLHVPFFDFYKCHGIFVDSVGRKNRL